MKIGDLVTDDRSHMDKSNWFWNAWIRRGVVVEVHNPKVVSVVWHKNGKMWRQCEQVKKLERISESR